MENYFKDCKITVGKAKETAFLNRHDIYQDGTVPMYRDGKGRLWALSGHSHLGHIGMFCGTCIDDLKEVYPIKTNFEVGRAGEAFGGIKYPEGVMSRGSIWPFGLYICPNTNRFFVFFHNETGWNGKGTGYIVSGAGDGEPDFRHIGLMHSDDEGRTWDFDRWVLTSEEVCFSAAYNPDSLNVRGQSGDFIKLGAGDFSLFVHPQDDFMYLFYNILTLDNHTGLWVSCDAFVARTRKRTDGVMGDFVKYYNGAFSEPGNFGKESAIIAKAWHPRVLYLQPEDLYIMSSSDTGEYVTIEGLVKDIMNIRTSKNLLDWSPPVSIPCGDGFFGNHYTALVSDEGDGQPHISHGKMAVLSCHNGTDVLKYSLNIQKIK